MNFAELAVFRLSAGAHHSAEDVVCAMEAVAWLEGEKHSDRPACACPVIASYVRVLNDEMDNEDRQELIPFLPKLVGTVSQEHEQARAEYLAWQAIRVFAPVSLEAVGFGSSARRLREFDGNLVAASDIAYQRGASYQASVSAKAAGAFFAFSEAAVFSAYAAAAAVLDTDRSWHDALNALAGVLEIGPSGGFSQDITPRVQAYRKLVAA